MELLLYAEKNILQSSNDSKYSKGFINEIHVEFTAKDIYIKCCNFNINHYHQSLFDELDIFFPESIERSVIKRQAEFLAGRMMAISALNLLGEVTNNIAIGKHRNPIWPNNITASITHTKTTALCAASYNNDQYLGVDLEDIISVKLMKQIQNTVITNLEAIVLRKTNLCFNEAFTITFSAKESLFKALYPSTGYYFDFFAAKIIAIDDKNKSFTLVLCEDLTMLLTAGTEFKGQYKFVQGQILTSIVI